MGKTQGMMLSSSPPRTAPSKAASTAEAPGAGCPPSSARDVPAAGTGPGTAFSDTPLPSLSFSTPSTASRLPPFDGASVSTIRVSPAREKVWAAA